MVLVLPLSKPLRREKPKRKRRAGRREGGRALDLPLTKQPSQAPGLAALGPKAGALMEGLAAFGSGESYSRSQRGSPALGSII